MRDRAAAIACLLLVLAPRPVLADVVTDWNKTAIEAMQAANMAGNPWSRALAMMHVAMSDAINSVQGGYERYLPQVTGAPSASPESAAAAAARHMNVRIWGGIHFRNSLEVGWEMGRKLAVFLVDNSLKPTR